MHLCKKLASYIAKYQELVDPFPKSGHIYILTHIHIYTYIHTYIATYRYTEMPSVKTYS